MNTFRKIWRILSSEQRRALLVLVVLTIVGTALETLGVGLVLPALALMTDAEPDQTYPQIAPLVHALGDPSREELVVWGLGALSGLYVLKALFLGFLTWKQMRFAFWMQADTSRRLLGVYLRQPYVFHLQRNSAHLFRNIVGEVGMMVSGAIMPGTLLVTEVAVLVAITVLLFVVEPLGALVAFVIFCLAGFGYHRLTRGRLSKWGQARQTQEGLRYQDVQQGLGAVKDVLLLGREADFLDKFRIHTEAVAQVAQRQATLQQVPRFLFEAVAILAIACLAFFMLARGARPEALVPTLGVFVAAAFRLMPSVSRVLSSVQSLRYAAPAVDLVSAELALPTEREDTPDGASLLLRDSLMVDSVSFRYPAADAWALSDVTLMIPRGASIGIVGGSGAGKSTLVDVILGLLQPEGGVVRVDGVDIRANMRGWQNQIGYVPQTIFLTDDTLRRNVAFGLPDAQIDEAAVTRAVRDAQLEDFVSQLPLGLDTVVGERGIRISGGQRQRIGIARALYHDPPILVLDEATSSLDTGTEREVMRAVRELKGSRTFLIVSHRYSTVEECTRLFRIEHGRLVDDYSPEKTGHAADSHRRREVSASD